MDLTTLDTRSAANEGAVIEILHPITEQPVGVQIVILGADSDAYQTALRQQQDSRMRRLQRRNALSLTLEEIEESQLDLLVACVKDWSGVVMAGKELACTPENVREVLAHPGLRWIREQIDRAIGDRANFLKV